MRSATPNVVRDCLDEIERLAARIAELEAECDEAREAAQFFYGIEIGSVPVTDRHSFLWHERWPWLEA